MLYNYKCKKCGNTKQFNIQLNELSSLKPVCSCGEPMIRDWKAGIVVAENDKASNIDEMSWVNQSLKKRPSGKTQVLY